MALYGTSYFDEDEDAPWQALLGIETPEAHDPEKLRRLDREAPVGASPYGLSDDERFAMERSAGFDARDPSTGFRPGKFDMPTNPDDPRFADARKSPIATPDSRPLLPEKRPSSVPEVAGPSPMLQQRARENSDNAAWRALAGGGAAQQPESSGGGLGDADILIAGLLDTVLNRGRNLPQMVQQKQQQEMAAREHAQRMQLAQQGMGPRGGSLRGPGGRAMSPEQLSLRQRYADIAEQRAQISRDREDRLSGRLKPEGAGPVDYPPPPTPEELDAAPEIGSTSSVEDGRTPEEREIDEARHALLNMEKPPRPGEAPKGEDGMTAYQRESLRLREKAIDQRGASKTPKTAAPPAGTGEQSEFTPKQRADLSAKLWKDTEYYRTGASFLQDAEGILEKYKPGSDIPSAGMFDSRKPDFALGEDGLRLRYAQQWMNNAIQRADSGAAAPIPEELKFAFRSGANPGATEAQFRVGLAAARQYLKGELSSAAAGREGIARDVYRRQGIEDWVFGAREGGEGFNPPPPAGDSLDVSPQARSTAQVPASAKPIGTRNGKSIVHIEKRREGGKLRIVFHYADGSSETVER